MLNIFVFNIKFRQIEINIKQKECKGFYDKNQKCRTTKCHVIPRYECKSSICSKNYIEKGFRKRYKRLREK